MAIAQIQKSIERLFQVDPANAPAVRDALDYFYSYARSEHRKTLPGEFNVAQVVTNAVADHLQKLFDGLSSTADEQAEMAQAVKLLKLSGANLDALDNAPDRKELTYHHNVHDLFVGAARLAVMRLAAGADLTPRKIIEMAKEVTLANFHDYGHGGRTNSYVPGETPEVDHPGHQEMETYELAAPGLKAAGASDQFLAKMKWTLLATDPNLPGEIIKYGFAYHHDHTVPVLSWSELESRVASSPVPTQAYVRQFMDIVMKDPQFVADAMSLKGSDMVVSFGMGSQLWTDSTRGLDIEYKNCGAKTITDDNDNPIPTGQLFVLMKYVGVKLDANNKPEISFLVPAVDHLFSDPLNEVVNTILNQIPAQEIQSLWDNFAKDRVLLDGTGKEQPLAEVIEANLNLDKALKRGAQPHPVSRALVATL
jgi:hypothetical protein